MTRCPRRLVINLSTMRNHDGRKCFVFIIISAVVLLLGSCDRRRTASDLDDIESYINERPDSALMAIRQIDTSTLCGRAERAKYALLHAAALDKNYIDTADTRVVQPAVDWYERHGKPEDRLKAYMYLGTEQLNGGEYNKAIVSFYKARTSASGVEDKNLLGVLCSKIADTYSGTMDYAQASSYIDESIEYFRQCGRKDQEAIELLRKSFNLTRRRLWDQADSCFKELLSIKSLEKGLRNRALVGYGMFLLNNPDPDEKLALSILSSAIEEGGKLEKLSQVYAYAYLLKTQGMETESEALMRMADRFKTKDEYSYHYWKYREYLKSGDMIAAHRSLWAAMNVMDSIRIRSYEGSAANSQRSFLELTVSAQELRIRARKREIIIISLLCLVIALASSVVYQLNKAALQRKKEEKERMEMLVERLEEQVKDLNNGNRQKAAFSFLGEIYEEAYRTGKSSDNLTKVIQSKIGDLRSDPAAQKNFEALVDNKMDGLMSRFRKDCPDLSDSDYRMSSYYFAGFDNTTVMIIMGIASLENTRSRKSYLRKKLSEKYGKIGDLYSSIIGGVA